MRGKSGIVAGAAAFALLCGCGAALAQSESKTWYVPWAPTPPGVEQGGISITNLAGEAAAVNVRAFNAQGAVLSEASTAFTLQPGASSFTPFPAEAGSVAKRPAFALVLAAQPVLVRANAFTKLARYVTEADCSRVSSRGDTNGVLFCPGALGRYDANGKFVTEELKMWNYAALQPLSVYPIDCAGAAANHFACSKQVHQPLPGQASTVDVGSVGDASADESGPSKPPKSRSAEKPVKKSD